MAPVGTQPSVVLALGGGGARGLAQIGVIEVLQARGLVVEAVAGTSCGALVGGAFAAGKLDALRDWMLRTGRNEMLRLLDPGLGRPALFTGERLVRTLREVVGSPRIEDLPIDFTAVAVDLLRQREVWLRRGDLWDALRASFAIPGSLPERADEPVRVVDTEEGDAAAAPASLIGRWMERLGEVTSASEPQPRFGLMEVMSRALDTMQERIARVQLALEPPELLIRIPRDACQFYEFWRASELIDIGRREAEKALDAAGY